MPHTSLRPCNGTPHSGSVVEAVDAGEVIGSQEVREHHPTMLNLERVLPDENTGTRAAAGYG
jgi:hypothetical protein